MDLSADLEVLGSEDTLEEIVGIQEEGDQSSEGTQDSQEEPPQGEDRPWGWETPPWRQSLSWSDRSLAETLLWARMLPWWEELFLWAVKRCLGGSLEQDNVSDVRVY